MRRSAFIAALFIAALYFLAYADRAHAAVTVQGPGLGYSCYLFAEYGYVGSAKEESPFDICTAALTETLDSNVRAATFVNRSIVLVRMGFFDKAVVDCRNAIRLAPMLGEAHTNLGVGLMKQGNFQEALPELDKGIELGVSKPYLAYYNRAMVREALKDFRSAYLDYKQSAQLNPDFALAPEDLKRFTVVGKSAQ